MRDPIKEKKNSNLRVLKLFGQNGTCADNSKLNNNDNEFRMIIGLAKFDNF